MATLFAGLIWLMMLVAFATPPYTGPATVGQAFPSFETRLAGGGSFQQGDLRGDKDTVLLFFRGRWRPVCMVELGELERNHAEFEKRNVRVVVASLEGQEDAKLTQLDFPHLVVVADEKGELIKAAEVLHKSAGPKWEDIAAPTTFFIDKQ